MAKDRVGETNKNKRGTLMEIIKYNSSEDMDIRFLDEFFYVKKGVTYSAFKNGGVKNPFDRNVYGIGYIGLGEHAVKIGNDKTQEYRVWHELIARCYSKERKSKYLSYYNTTKVCDEWKCYQRCADWYSEHKYECGELLHLDKDILYPGNKIYSPYTCLLVPQRINMIFTNKPNTRGLPNGVVKTKDDRYEAVCNKKKYGIYDTVEETFAAYAKAKEDIIKQVADEYKDIIPQNVYDALYNYKLDIRLDKNYQKVINK